MLFNSINFAVFLPMVFILYWFAAKSDLSIQNILLLVSSYFFYSCWDWRFLFLLIFSTLLDYFAAIKITVSDKHSHKKFWFWLSILINVGFLGVFKYYNFFVENFANLLSLFGLHTNVSTLNVILPVGISFYTFHGLSYIIDVFNKKINAEKNFIDYAVFVSFFPLLVAGPIERATHLLPQIKSTRNFEYIFAVDGLKQILWGLFKKVVVADQCAFYANEIFNNSSDYQGSTLVLGAVLFSFQIYGDFSGYSDIALGTAKLLGFELLRNFSYPYFSRDIAEFWRRWHISLSSWFRDYIYIPIGGSKGGIWNKIRNTFIIFLISGFWHGANWTFIVWGGLNALFILPSIVLNTNRNNLETVAKGKIFPSVGEFASIIFTFSLTTFAWIFFRSEDLTIATNYIKSMFSISIIEKPSIFPPTLIILISTFILMEWLGREEQYAISKILYKNKGFRWSLYLLLSFLILLFQGKEQQFIYFQF